MLPLSGQPEPRSSGDEGAPATVVQAETLFTLVDDTFDPTEWADSLIFDTTPAPGASYTAKQDVSFGLDAPSRMVTHTFCGDGVNSLGMADGHWKTQVFDPAGQDVVSLSFRFNMRALGVGVLALVKQADTVYTGAQQLQPAAVEWGSYFSQGLTEDNFRVHGGQANPDFRKPMQFGFATANSTRGAGCPTSTSWIDNFQVDVLAGLPGEAPNLPPIALDDDPFYAWVDTFGSIIGGPTIYIDVLANDYDPDGDSLFLTAVKNIGIPVSDKAIFHFDAPFDRDVIEYTQTIAGPSIDGGHEEFRYVVSDGLNRDSAKVIVEFSSQCAIDQFSLNKTSEGDSFDLALILRFRDEVMRPTEDGARIIAAYYGWTFEAVQILAIKRPDLGALLVEMLVLLQPSLSDMLDGDGSLKITQAQMDTVALFFTQLSGAASDGLRQVIVDEMDRLGPLNDYVGLPATDALETVLGPRTAVAIDDEVPSGTNGFLLEQNLPNPFAASTEIKFALPESEAISLEVFDIQGRKVRTLVRAKRASGTHLATWDGLSDLHVAVPSGLYLVRLSTPSFSQARKVVLRR